VFFTFFSLVCLSIWQIDFVASQQRFLVAVLAYLLPFFSALIFFSLFTWNALKIPEILSFICYTESGTILRMCSVGAKGTDLMMENRKSILPPTDDRLFKLLMTSPDLQPGLMDIISGIIRQPVAAVEVRNNELPTDDVNDKQERLDVNCVTGDGRQVNLEMQASRMQELAGGQHENLKNKAVYYLCDLYATQSVKGKDYHNLAKTYQVTFCTYTVFPERESFVNEFSLRNEEGEALSDAVTVVFVELSKLDRILSKPVEQMTSLEMWSIFLQYADKPEQEKIVQQVAEAKGEIKMALEVLINVSQDERERAINRSRRMYQTDLESNMNTALERGRIEGRAENQRNVVLNMRSKGLDDATIAEITGYSAEEVRRI
jgi:predicted transposase/invertase (TIGR01784 family)